MKYVLNMVLASLLSAAAIQANAQQSTAVKILKPVIERQCAIELNDSRAWKASSYLMTEANKQAFEKEVCSCVGENALNDVGVMEIAQAMLTEEAKNELVRKAVLNSIKSCVLQSKK
ncbi:hypothetical protein [Acinetobacter tianfuensis]|uniref:Uncharacterized protein n=1 Tax=Acinetobacter tianfuensis TaxID=2419603 RepID=A0A3A8E906_9GAMM|nr:hypothetical protein [Acinetobacter tianfuensis]RKG31075.1 hypothetical protein D7V32_09325 [Acinetobacter tianfuensis]